MGRSPKCKECGKAPDALSAWKCKRCYENFCGEHRLPESHNCTPKPAPCRECGAVSAVYICDRCIGAFCAKHERPEEHDCVPGRRPEVPLHMRHYGRKKSHSRTRIISALVAGLFAVAMVYLFILAPDTVDRVAIPEDIAVPISNIANLTETLQLESLVRTESGFDATVVEQYIFVYTNAERTEMGIAGLSSVPLIQ